MGNKKKSVLYFRGCGLKYSKLPSFKSYDATAMVHTVLLYFVFDISHDSFSEKIVTLVLVLFRD